MAKKKEVAIDIEAEIIKKYGEVLFDGSLLLEEEKEVFSVGSPLIDWRLNGGIPEGSTVLFSGPHKSGKTTLALQCAVDFQRSGRKVFFIDAEHRLKRMNLEGVNGLDPNKIIVNRSVRGAILTGENLLTITSQIMRNNPECLIIFDSASAICPENRMDEDINAATRSTAPKMWSDFCKQNAGVICVNNIVIILIQHFITNTSGKGKKYLEDGGVKLQYQADVKLRCNWYEKWMDGDDQIGNKLHWDVVTSALGGPGGEVTSHIRFGHGVDTLKESFDLACDFGIVSKAGAWYSTIVDEQEYKAQGEHKFMALMEEKPPILSYIQNQTKEMLV